MIGSITTTSFAQDFQITPTQLKQTNILFNKLEYLESRDSINDSIISLLKYRDSVFLKHDSLLTNNVRALEYKTDSIQANLDKTTKKYKRTKGFAIGGGIVSICLLILLLL